MKEDTRPLYLPCEDESLRAIGARFVRRTDRLLLDKFQMPLNPMKFDTSPQPKQPWSEENE
jgi:hypothetical protein